MKRIRVGIIGHGRSGQDIHGVHLAKDPRFRIVAVADHLAERREAAASRYGCDTHADHRGLLEFNGGSLANTGPHPLDQALELFGDGHPEVFCHMDRTEATTGDAENHVKLLLRGPGHPLVDLEISSCCAYPCFTYQIYGTRGGLKGTQTEAAWRYYDPAALAPLRLVREPLADPATGNPVFCHEDVAWQTGIWPDAPGAAEGGAGYVPGQPESSPTQAFYDMLHRSLTLGAPLEITPQQVRRQIAVIEECRRQNPQIYPA